MDAGTLINPGGIDVNKKGTLFVTNKSTQAGTGEVLRITLTD